MTVDALLPHPVAAEALERFIASAAGANGVHIETMRRLSGGAIQENWLVDAQAEGGRFDGRLALVLRTDAPSGVQASHGRAQEFALLEAAFTAGVRVPEPLWLCEDRAVLGRDFFVMRRIDGVTAAHRVVRDATLAVDRVRLATQLGEQLARIHSMSLSDRRLVFLPISDDVPALHLIRRARAYLDVHPATHPALEWGCRWLERHARPTAMKVLCHRDFRTGNYMVDGNGLTGILDWEFAGASDPLEDIGWFCARCWRFGRDEREAGGIGEREDFYCGYESVAGQSIDRERVPYWEVMAHLNWAIIALQQAQRHASGEEVSLSLALTGAIVPELEWEILAATGAAQ